ncbi:MAG: trigger factor [Pyrinomonadaceae bacterium]
MKSELQEISPTERKISVTVEPASLKEAYNSVSRKFAGRANVPGFRKGNAPLEVVRLRFKDEIRGEVLQQVVSAAAAQAIAEHNQQPLTEPHLHLDNAESVSIDGAQPLNFEIHFEVMPEIAAPNYEGLEVVRRVKPVEDGEIEDIIANRLQKETALIPVEGRPSQIGDTVVVDLEGRFDDDPTAEPIKADDLEVTLGDEVIEKSFTENLVGVTVDEEKEFTVSYPDDFSSPALAGKTVHYKAKVRSVGVSETPEANDEWAKSLDEGYESLDDLRKKLRADLEQYAAADADARVRNNAIAKLIEQNPIDIPRALIESQARSLLNNFARDLQERGVDLNKVENDFVQMAYQQMQTQAERDVRGALLLEKIGQLENVEVTDDDLNDELRKMAEYYRTDVEQLRDILSKQQNGLESIKNNLRTRKTVEALVSKAKVTEGEWIEETQVSAEESESSAAENEKKEKPKKAAKPKAASAKKAAGDEPKKPRKKSARSEG